MVSGDKKILILLLHKSLLLASVSGKDFGHERRKSERFSKEILEYQDGDGWRKVGEMKNGRE